MGWILSGWTKGILLIRQLQSKNPSSIAKKTSNFPEKTRKPKTTLNHALIHEDGQKENTTSLFRISIKIVLRRSNQ
jgi:hypothetical protein